MLWAAQNDDLASIIDVLHNHPLLQVMKSSVKALIQQHKDLKIGKISFGYFLEHFVEEPLFSASNGGHMPF